MFLSTVSFRLELLMIQAPNDDRDNEKKLPGEINVSETPELESCASEPEEELILPSENPLNKKRLC